MAGGKGVVQVGGWSLCERAGRSCISSVSPSTLPLLLAALSPSQPRPCAQQPKGRCLHRLTAFRHGFGGARATRPFFTSPPPRIPLSDTPPPSCRTQAPAVRRPRGRRRDDRDCEIGARDREDYARGAAKGSQGKPTHRPPDIRSVGGSATYRPRGAPLLAHRVAYCRRARVCTVALAAPPHLHTLLLTLPTLPLYLSTPSSQPRPHLCGMTAMPPLSREDTPCTPMPTPSQRNHRTPSCSPRPLCTSADLAC